MRLHVAIFIWGACTCLAEELMDVHPYDPKVRGNCENKDGRLGARRARNNN